MKRTILSLMLASPFVTYSSASAVAQAGSRDLLRSSRLRSTLKAAFRGLR